MANPSKPNQMYPPPNSAIPEIGFEQPLRNTSYSPANAYPHSLTTVGGAHAPPYGYQLPAGGIYPPSQNNPQPHVYPKTVVEHSLSGADISSVVIAQPTRNICANESTMNIMPDISTRCATGLEYLNSVDQLLVHQKVELLEVMIGFETNNKYAIKNSIGQEVYYAEEDTDCCSRNCCGPARPFDMKIFDNYKNEIIHFYRPLACSSCCFPCCLQSLQVCSPPGCPIGSVQQNWSIITPQFSVKDADGETVLYIEGPFCTFSFCRDVVFKVLSRDKSEVVGKISKQWSGLLKEYLTDADNFGITFPIDLDVNIKALLLGACFLIDFMYFEKKNR